MGLKSAKGDAVKMNEIVSLKDIVVDFDGERILDELSLDIHDKEFVTFLGPSGCGKTTLLRMIIVFNTIEGGTFKINDRVINAVIHLVMGVPQVPVLTWCAPLIGAVLWAPLHFLLDALRLGRRK